MPRPRKPRPALPVHRFAVTLPGVDIRVIKHDLAKANLLRRSKVQERWRVRKATAKHLFEERVWDRTGKLDIFPTEAGKAKLLEMYAAGQLTMKVGHSPATTLSDQPNEQS